MRWPLVVIVLGCAARTPHPATITAPGWLERARAFERGSGGTRDYAAAVAIYRDACAGGRGEIDACIQWLHASEVVRAPLARPAMRELGRTLCVERRDPFGCVIATFSSEGPVDPEVEHIARELLVHPIRCDADHVSGCWTESLLGLILGGDSQAVDRQEHASYLLCQLGYTDGCIATTKMYALRYEADVMDARHRLVAACDAGDADACPVAPGRSALPPAQLCAAHDLRACAD